MRITKGAKIVYALNLIILVVAWSLGFGSSGAHMDWTVAVILTQIPFNFVVGGLGCLFILISGKGEKYMVRQVKRIISSRCESDIRKD